MACRRGLRLGLAVVGALLGFALSTSDAAGEQPWWNRAGLAGANVLSVAVDPSGVVTVSVAGRGTLASADGGHSFRPAAIPPPPARSGAAPPPPAGWRISLGRILRPDGRLDPRAPDLGPDARLVAVPAGVPGDVVAVASDDVVWRRDPSGDWNQVLLLLPVGGLSGRPTITGVAAFETSGSRSVYISTAGYSTLVSPDGGIEWLRAGAGLPDTVWAVAAGNDAVYAATPDGLWVHHVRALPSAPIYDGGGLGWRHGATALIALIALVVSAATLDRLAASDPS